MIPEMAPETFARLHGLKVAVAPLPMFADHPQMSLENRKIVPAGVEEKFNKQGFDSPFGYFRDTWLDELDEPDVGVFLKFTYSRTLPGGLTYPEQHHRRWLGMADMGDEEENLGRSCMPGIQLHPVKDVK